MVHCKDFILPLRSGCEALPSSSTMAPPAAVLGMTWSWLGDVITAVASDSMDIQSLLGLCSRPKSSVRWSCRLGGPAGWTGLACACCCCWRLWALHVLLLCWSSWPSHTWEA